MDERTVVAQEIVGARSKRGGASIDHAQIAKRSFPPQYVLCARELYDVNGRKGIRFRTIQRLVLCIHGNIMYSYVVLEFMTLSYLSLYSFLALIENFFCRFIEFFCRNWAENSYHCYKIDHLYVIIKFYSALDLFYSSNRYVHFPLNYEDKLWSFNNCLFFFKRCFICIHINIQQIQFENI